MKIFLEFLYTFIIKSVSLTESKHSTIILSEETNGFFGQKLPSNEFIEGYY